MWIIERSLEDIQKQNNILKEQNSEIKIKNNEIFLKSEFLKKENLLLDKDIQEKIIDFNDLKEKFNSENNQFENKKLENAILKKEFYDGKNKIENLMVNYDKLIGTIDEFQNEEKMMKKLSKALENNVALNNIVSKIQLNINEIESKTKVLNEANEQAEKKYLKIHEENNKLIL